ncbi:MAG: endonuclease MutS2, partial [Deltaproteobacteria bacterium]
KVMLVDEKTKEALGFPSLLELLAEKCITGIGRKACLSLEPLCDRQLVAWRQACVEQLADLLDRGKPPPIEDIEDVRPLLQRATKGGVLDARGVRSVASAMVVTSRLRRYLMTDGQDAGGACVEVARKMHDLSSLGRDLGQAFDPTGQLRDSASEQLGPLRRQATALAESIRRRLENMLQKPSLAPCLSDRFITIRNDRYVIPVRADAPNSVRGIVHDTSQSGPTLFVEPEQLVEMGNRLKLAQAAVQEEELRILREFSSEIAQEAGRLEDNLKGLELFEPLLAASRLKNELKGHFPAREGSGFRLLSARHPLMVLSGGRVVPNDLVLEGDRRCLVISGPNAGGKTVALKTIGLSVLMAQAGIAPAVGEGSRCQWFDGLHAVIGDDQDIGRGLSSFTAQMARVARIMEQAGPGYLVLLDELASDTDPVQGAALAEAILERLVEAGATVVVATHFDQLKQLGYTDARFANASVGFDTNRMEPTYGIVPDTPGRSLTFEIAARTGLDSETVERANELLQPDERRLGRMLDGIERERFELQELRRELEERKEEIERMRRRNEQRAQELEAERREISRKQRGELLEHIAGARREVANIIESLRTADMKKAVEASRELKALEKRFRSGMKRGAADVRGRADVKRGQKVRLVKLGGEGTVLEVDARNKTAVVAVGAMHTRLPLEQLEPIADGNQSKDSRSPSAGRDLHAYEPAAERTAGNTLDLRGRRTDEAIPLLEKFLDDMFMRGESAAYVIHGHGTGALKSAVREHLARSPYPKEFHPAPLEQGGDGVTVVSLK